MVLSRNDRKSSPSVTKKSAVLILDEGGRVLAVACFNSNGTVTYTYDAQNQLLSAVNGTTTYAYTYDTVGNILSGNGHTYTYGDAGWKDLLTAVDGQSITYDAMGNPTSYYNGNRWAFTWAQGRRLTSASDGTNTISYTYDADGLRTGKTVNGVEHTYYYAGGKLLRETFGSNTMDFFYDSNGNAYALKYNGILYYYITNLQGDVMSIVDAQGAVVASYEYDPYGNLISDEPAENTVGHLNPIRYRGYVYDPESELYYLQSRYYDPEIGRFLNADAFASTGQGILGNNMFAYCNNNPVNACDKNGKAPDTLAGWIGEELGKLIYEWFEEETEEDKEKIADGTVSYSSKGKGNGASIYNSHEIDTPWVMYQYVAANRGDEIGGTTIGVVVEWIFHNTAYEAGTALNIERISNPAEHLDVGNTIYSDRRSGFSLELMMSLGMQLIYTVFLPIPAAYDLGVETGRWDHVYPRE